MTATALFYIIIGILVLNFVIDKILDTLNAKHFNDPIPAELQDVYNKEEYEKCAVCKLKTDNINKILNKY